MTTELQRIPLVRSVLDAVLRRRRVVMLALAVPLAGAVAAALFLPRSYRSVATVVVERGAGISDDDVDARLSSLASENLSRSRLFALIKRFKPYRGALTASSREPLVDQMLKDVSVEVEKEDRAGRSVTTGMHVAYVAHSPQLAADVANELADFYQREDLRMRQQRAQSAVTTLSQQLAEAKTHLDEQAVRLKDFKMRNLNELPEQVGLHLSELALLNSQMHSGRGDTQARHGGGVRSPAEAPVFDPRLERLAELRSRYTDEYPEVRALKREIELHPLVRDDSAARANAAAAAEEESFSATLAAERAESSRRRNADLAEKAARHEQGILNAPFRQQELDGLLPDYIAARNQYQSLWEKYQTAKLWDPERDGGRIMVLDRAAPRSQAIAPNVTRILALGVAVALAIAAAAIVLLERSDTSFHNVDDLRVFTRVPVLATVPRVVSAREKRRRAQGARAFAAKLLVLLAFTFAGSAYLSLGTPTLVAWIHHIRP